MTHNDLLFQQIMEQPEDDGLRLMYADRLEQEGHHDRAEFIRVQCALNSAALQSDQRSQLEVRERELLRRYACQIMRSRPVSVTMQRNSSRDHLSMHRPRRIMRRSISLHVASRPLACSRNNSEFGNVSITA